LPIYENAEGIFLRGNGAGWAEFIPASAFSIIGTVYGADPKGWEYTETWDTGRWIALIKDLEPYAHIDE
jgi:hypothetical protein